MLYKPKCKKENKEYICSKKSTSRLVPSIKNFI